MRFIHVPASLWDDDDQLPYVSRVTAKGRIPGGYHPETAYLTRNGILQAYVLDSPPLRTPQDDQVRDVREVKTFGLCGCQNRPLLVEAQAEASGVSQATELVELAADAELFHTAGGKGFATLGIDGHREAWPLCTKAFRRWLARRFYTEHDKAPGTQAIQDAINILEGQAQFDGP